MATQVNRVVGTLHLGDTVTGVDMEAQVSTIGVPQTVTRDAAVTVLTGELIFAAAVYSHAMTGTMLLDYMDPTGVYYFVQSNRGNQLEFTFAPSGTNGPTWAGTLICDGWNTEEVNSGTTALSKFSWPIQGDPTITPPAAA
jgi:hypothetical protein